MQNKEIEKILDCSECKFATCEQCEISYTEKTKIKKYIEDIEQKNKLLSNTTNELIHLHNVTPNSVIREKIEEIKAKGSELEKTKENVMFCQGYYRALEEILKEGEK